MELITTQALGKTYRNGGVDTTALKNISLTVRAGEFVAVMGPSGSGKSTLLHLLGLLDEPSEGKYWFSGENVSALSDIESARIRNQKMGFVFQAFNLLARESVFANVRLPLLYSDIPEKAWGEKVEKAIEAVGLSHRQTHECGKLSGGERQRVAIARALVCDPKVIFADEPTGNLDSQSGRLVMETLERLNETEKRTIVLITHETYTARHAKRIIQIRDGSIERDEERRRDWISGEVFVK